jgi:hypothetical protein
MKKENSENQVVISMVEELIREKNTYQNAFETVMNFLKKYEEATNDGSILLNLMMDAASLPDEGTNGRIGISHDAYMLIEDSINGDIETRIKEIDVN